MFSVVVGWNDFESGQFMETDRSNEISDIKEVVKCFLNMQKEHVGTVVEDSLSFLSCEDYELENKKSEKLEMKEILQGAIERYCHQSKSFRKAKSVIEQFDKNEEFRFVWDRYLDVCSETFVCQIYAEERFVAESFFVIDLSDTSFGYWTDLKNKLDSRTKWSSIQNIDYSEDELFEVIYKIINS